MKPTLILLSLCVAINIMAQNTIPQNFILIPGGEFIMGKNTPNNGEFSPAHKVKIDSFYMDFHEVTNAEYASFCKATGYKFPEFWNVDIFRSGEKYPDYPVVGVSWYDAKKYADWAGKRLPTEAEWEYAARAGLVDKDYPTGDTLGRVEEKKIPGIWENRIVKVTSFLPNAFGLCDMDGNVWEWASDSFDGNYYKTSPENNPKGPASGFYKTIRSGSWHSGNMCKKVYYRKGLPGNWVDFAVGFRCAQNIR